MELSTRRTQPLARARVHLDCSAAEAFALVTDVDRLPEWNALIERVEMRPPELNVGAVWKVAMRKGAMAWVSRSEVVELDPIERHFTYRSCTDDVYPSYAEWTWRCDPTPDGTTVTVSWYLRPATFLRRWFLAPMRSWMLRREVPVSLAALRRTLEGSGR